MCAADEVHCNKAKASCHHLCRDCCSKVLPLSVGMQVVCANPRMRSSSSSSSATGVSPTMEAAIEATMEAV